MEKDAALTKLLRLVRQLAWNPHSRLGYIYQQQLREALRVYEQAANKPTAYDRLLTEDLFEGPESGTRCLHCTLPFHERKKGQKYCSTICRKRAWQSNKAV